MVDRTITCPRILVSACGGKAGRKKEKKKKESKVNANRPRYPNDGIYTGRLHGDDLQPNRLICLRYSIFYEQRVVHRRSSVNRFSKQSFRTRR